MAQRDAKHGQQPRKKLAKENYNTAKGYFGFALDHECPIVVCDCLAFLRNRGLYEVGVFRIPGNLDVVNELKQEYNAIFDSKSAKEEDRTSILNNHKPAPSVNDVASLLKAYFKDLSEPLIPVESTRAFVDVLRKGLDKNAEVKQMSKIMKDMKSPNRECLGLIVSFLREVCAFRKFNNMTADNLSTCFVLSIMGGGNAFDQLSLLGSGAQIIRKLIGKDIKIYMPSIRNVRSCTRYKDVDPEDIEQKTGKYRPNPENSAHRNFPSAAEGQGPPVPTFHGMQKQQIPVASGDFKYQGIEDNPPSQLRWGHNLGTRPSKRSRAKSKRNPEADYGEDTNDLFDGPAPVSRSRKTPNFKF